MSTDRLSELPDSLLLLCVLNRLERKQVVKTSLLSKRWRSLWADLPWLVFWEASTEPDKIQRLVSVVHSALVNRTQNYLKGFSVKFEYDECFASDVNTWLEFAANYKTKYLNLYLSNDVIRSTKHKHFYELPQMMDSNSSLEHVSLERCNLPPPRNSIEWPSLTSLEIVDAELPQYLIEKILSNCPVLDTLKLRYCRGFSCLDIKSQRLRHLEIRGWSSVGGEGLLEICAPNLTYLDIWMKNHKGEKMHLKDISPLSYAALDFLFYDYAALDLFIYDDDDDFGYVEVMNKVDQLLQQVQHVPKLTLGNGIIQIVSKMVATGRPLPQLSVDVLSVTTRFKDDAQQQFCGVVDLLDSSPKLECLTIDCSNYSEEVITWGLTAENDMVDDLVNLKTIYIFGFPYGCCEILLTMTQILLKRAIVLEEMEIDLYPWPPACSSEITQKLKSYPRSSQKAQLHINSD